MRSTLRQCVRDWSEEGAAERSACYGPILSELERLYPDRAARAAVKVLVPGSGLGRLVWEMAYRGFQAVGNEFSYQMLLGAFLILNCCKEKNIFTSQSHTRSPPMLALRIACALLIAPLSLSLSLCIDPACFSFFLFSLPLRARQ